MYLLLIMLFAALTAAQHTIKSHFAQSIFAECENKFWHPSDYAGWNAVTVFSTLRVVVPIAAVILTQHFAWWGIPVERLLPIWQFAAALGIYMLSYLLFLFKVFSTVREKGGDFE